MLIILPQLFALSIPIPPARDKPLQHRRTNIPMLIPKIEPMLAGPYIKPRASGKAKIAIAAIPIRYKKALKNAQIATRSNKSGLFIVLTSLLFICFPPLNHTEDVNGTSLVMTRGFSFFLSSQAKVTFQWATTSIH